ncbi:AraC family transcriptional regulator [Novispirillum sp. DQ9]|uniref:AraC family transcriptional regulator n=1 Tax=Novispirillum sp. DQ9 TaxID=3398612 RepID=UPI003C79B47F
MPITVDVKTLPPFTAACLSHLGPMDDIAETLREALDHAARDGLVAADTRPVRLCLDVMRQGTPGPRHFDAGVTIAEGTTDTGTLRRTAVRGGTYAVALHRGPYGGIGRTYRWLLESWLPDSGYALRPGPGVEVYLNDLRTTGEADLLTEIRLPLRPAA